MSSYVVFADPPSVEELYANWAQQTPVFRAVDVNSTDTFDESFEESYAAYAKAEELSRLEPVPIPATYSKPLYSVEPAVIAPAAPSDSILLPPPSQIVRPAELNDVDMIGHSTYVNESSYADAGSTVHQFPDYRFDASFLTPLNTYNQVVQQRKEDGIPGAPQINLVGFVVSIEPVKFVNLRTRKGQGRVVEFSVGDESGGMKLTVTAWDAQARTIEDNLRIGDIIYLSNVSLSHNTFKGFVIGQLGRHTQFQICWRTKRVDESDDLYRPSLDLAVFYKHGPSLRVQAILDFAKQFLSHL